MKKRGLFIGRFNPPHYGHLTALKTILEENNLDEVIIGIGSAQESFTITNPFSAGERFEMIELGIEEMKLNSRNIIIIPIPDINNNNQWVDYIRSFLPNFHIVYSNNPLVKLLIEKNQNLEVRSIKLNNRKEFSSTNIRSKIINEDKLWKEFIPNSIADYLEKIGGLNRIKTLASNDYK